jgi:hypothetical protein
VDAGIEVQAGDPRLQVRFCHGGDFEFAVATFRAVHEQQHLAGQQVRLRVARVSTKHFLQESSGDVVLPSIDGFIGAAPIHPAAAGEP